MQAEADGADRRRKVPDVRFFDRSRNDEQRMRSVLAAIVAKTPMRARRNGLVGAFVGVKSKDTNDIALSAANNVAHRKLSAIKSI